eukprot:TRINITY_DN19123_c0_g1_i1.p1 TRINITY_DN19123_c0_g1~~TRINITY_DN19123_c0_g1_i1.p1  ORF type:complete len:184 (+),score=57.42 TRINITY_DN19123_c0_g1_i1:22-552(+)
MREKTPAERKLQDDVPEPVKKRRLQEVIQTFYEILFQKNSSEIGKKHLVLVEGKSRKSPSYLKGRSDTNKKVIFPDIPTPLFSDDGTFSDIISPVKPGDYVVVVIESSSGVSLRGHPIVSMTQQQFYNVYQKFTQKDNETTSKIRTTPTTTTTTTTTPTKTKTKEHNHNIILQSEQ